MLNINVNKVNSNIEIEVKDDDFEMKTSFSPIDLFNLIDGERSCSTFNVKIACKSEPDLNNHACINLYPNPQTNSIFLSSLHLNMEIKFETKEQMAELFFGGDKEILSIQVESDTCLKY
jgi:hypothetical protein